MQVLIRASNAMSSEGVKRPLTPWLGLPVIAFGLVFLIWLRPDLGADDRARALAQDLTRRLQPPQQR